MLEFLYYKNNNIIVKLFETVCNLIILNTYDYLVFTWGFHYHYLLLHLKNSSETLLLGLPLLLHWYEQRYCWVPLSDQTNWGHISLLLFNIHFRLTCTGMDWFCQYFSTCLQQDFIFWFIWSRSTWHSSSLHIEAIMQGLPPM